MTQQFEKNPNGGYLNPSKYGGWFGDVDITPELFAQIQQTGKLSLVVRDPANNQKGEPYVRVIAKPYDDSWKQNQPQQGGYQQQPAAPVPAPVAQPAPVQQAPVQQPAAAPAYGHAAPAAPVPGQAPIEESYEF